MNKHTLERKAVKIIMKEDMKQDEKDLLRAEIAIMRLVNHPNIIRMEAVYESKKVRRGREGGWVCFDDGGGGGGAISSQDVDILPCHSSLVVVEEGNKVSAERSVLRQG